MKEPSSNSKENKKYQINRCDGFKGKTENRGAVKLSEGGPSDPVDPGNSGDRGYPGDPGNPGDPGYPGDPVYPGDGGDPTAKLG